MGQETIRIACPNCKSDHMCWCGLENHHQTDFGDLGDMSTEENPATIVHKWQCVQCGTTFKQRLE